MSQVHANLPLSHSGVCRESLNGSLHGWSDFLGLAVSVACAIHCAALPALLAILPTWGVGWIVHHSFHQWMFVACFLVAVVAFIPGYCRHQRMMPAVLGVMGLTCLGFGMVGEQSNLKCNCESCSECRVRKNLDGWPHAGASALTPLDSIVSIGAENSLNGSSFMLANSSKSNTNQISAANRTVNRQSASISIPGNQTVAEFSAEVQPMDARSLPSGVRDLPSRVGALPSGARSLPNRSTQDSWLDFLMVWITPLGGLLLVVAHLSNYYFGDFCGCNRLGKISS